MASKRKCNYCKKYFDKSDGIDAGVSFFCCKEHMYGKKKKRSYSKNEKLFTTDLKKEVRDRDGNRCVFLCGNKDTEVHHIVYRSELGRIDSLGIQWSEKDLNHVSNLITLCSFHHHNVVHGDKEKWQPILRLYIWFLYVEGKRLTPKAIMKELNVNSS